VLIRPMRDSDVDAVVKLTLANYDGVMAEHHSAEVVSAFRAGITPESFREQMTWKQVYVAEDEGQVVAVGTLADFGAANEPKWTVSQFYVRADLHRRGIGRRLLAHLVAAAGMTDAYDLHVPSSRNAVPFYADAGFVVDRLQPDASREITWMTLPLGARAAEHAHRGDSLGRHDGVAG
jgi:GNAT superfamily N-acetyltransferase